MIKSGKGGGRTITGLRFESKVKLKDILLSIPGYRIDDDSVFFNDVLIAKLYSKHKLYKNLLEKNKIDYSTIISKKLLPDESILIIKSKTMFIIEIKFQQVQGSVDEKLQTCDFKRKQYQKLLAKLNLSVEYVYVLSDWFNMDKYKDVLSYIKSVNCYYFFNEIPLDFIGLPKTI